MRKKQHIYQIITIFSLFVFIAITLLPLEVFAQSSSERRVRSSSFRRKINNLDDEKVVNVPVPILFGVTPDNITPDFGDQRIGHLHEGQDILAPRRALIVSPTDAVVTRIGTGGSAGNHVYTANPGGETFAYLHLDEIADINEGDELQKGELIGYVGNTGNASGGVMHLHFEIRINSGATDPYPRLRSIFPLADKIKYLEDILDNADDEKNLAESIVLLYRKELVLAQTLNIALPASITKILIEKRTDVLGVTRTLRVGMSGDDVKLVQSILGISADGSFGPKTKTAVIAFQRRVGLPADGIFSPAVRIALANSSTAATALPAGCTSTTIYSPTTGIKCIAIL